MRGVLRFRHFKGVVDLKRGGGTSRVHFLLWTIDKSIVKGNMWVSVQWKTKVKTDGFTRLTYTGLWLCGELEHLKIERRLIGESFECVMGECVI